MSGSCIILRCKLKGNCINNGHNTSLCTSVNPSFEPVCQASFTARYVKRKDFFCGHCYVLQTYFTNVYVQLICNRIKYKKSDVKRSYLTDMDISTPHYPILNLRQGHSLDIFSGCLWFHQSDRDQTKSRLLSRLKCTENTFDCMWCIH